MEQARWELLGHIVALTHKPMIVLSFVWVGLRIMDFTTGLSPLLQTLRNVIWAPFYPTAFRAHMAIRSIRREIATLS
jgi:hypothetical protein